MNVECLENDTIIRRVANHDEAVEKTLDELTEIYSFLRKKLPDYRSVHDKKARKHLRSELNAFKKALPRAIKAYVYFNEQIETMCDIIDHLSDEGF